MYTTHIHNYCHWKPRLNRWGPKFVEGDTVLWNDQTYQVLYVINKKYIILHINKTYEKVNGPFIDKENAPPEKPHHNIFYCIHNLWNVTKNLLCEKNHISVANKNEWIPRFKVRDTVQDKTVIKIDKQTNQYVLFSPVIYDIDGETFDIMATKKKQCEM